MIRIMAIKEREVHNSKGPALIFNNNNNNLVVIILINSNNKVVLSKQLGTHTSPEIIRNNRNGLKLTKAVKDLTIQIKGIRGLTVIIKTLIRAYRTREDMTKGLKVISSSDKLVKIRIRNRATKICKIIGRLQMVASKISDRTLIDRKIKVQSLQSYIYIYCFVVNYTIYNSCYFSIYVFV